MSLLIGCGRTTIFPEIWIYLCEVLMDRDMGALVRAAVKDMQWNRPVEKIAKRQGVSEEIVEDMGDATKTSVEKSE